MKRCVKWFIKDGLEFIPGMEYKTEFNPVDNKIYIYTVWGFTTIDPLIVNTNFI